jgi:hypothetical protein
MTQSKAFQGTLMYATMLPAEIILQGRADSGSAAT